MHEPGVPRLMRVVSLAVPLVVCMAAPSGAGELPTAPADETAKARLETSPRHGELVTIDAGGVPLRAWMVHPERRDKAPVVVVIHEIFGLTDWIRAIADALAAEGFLAVAPDLLSGKGPGGGGTEAFESRDAVTKAVSGLERPEVLDRLKAVRAHALANPAASGKSAAIGFCWGGATSFAWAAAEPALDAAVVYYGTAPAEAAALQPIRAPVLGIYASDDARVTATLAATRDHMTALRKWYEPHVFEGAGHGFLRAQSGQGGANRAAAEGAWPLTLAFLRSRLSSATSAQ